MCLSFRILENFLVININDSFDKSNGSKVVFDGFGSEKCGYVCV